MINDSTSEIEVYRCWMCGNRRYVNHPKRIGVVNCVKCGGLIEESNVLNYCRKCLDGLKVFRKRGAAGPQRSPRRQGRVERPDHVGKNGIRKG